MYMLLGLAEQAGMTDPILYRDEDKEPSDPDDQLKGLEKAIEVSKDKIIPKFKKGQLPKEIEEKIERFLPPEQRSLLAPSEKVEAPENLLDKEAV